jgi:hypothetical protein
MNFKESKSHHNSPHDLLQTWSIIISWNPSQFISILIIPYNYDEILINVIISYNYDEILVSVIIS